MSLKKIDISCTEAKVHFGEMLDHCVYGEKEVYIYKHDKPVAVLVNLSAWDKKMDTERVDDDPPLYKKFLKLRAEIKRHQDKQGFSKEYIKKHSSVNLLREIRKERG